MQAIRHEPIEPARSEESAALFDRIFQALAGLRYGEIRLVLHDGVVVQVERTEKLRLPRGAT